MSGALEGRVALVTGGSRGIGRAIALSLARSGATVAVAARDAARVAGVVSEIEASGGVARPLALDVADADSTAAAFKELLDACGRIDVLVNNAGITRDNLMLRMKAEEWDAVLATNLTGLFRLTQLALKPMIRQRSGRIINVTSVVGITGNAGQANYAASKAGVIGFTRSVAREVATRGITVNAVAPGFIETDMTAVLNDKAREGMLGAIPMGRVGSPEDVAAAVDFLASDAAGYVTGQVLSVDGGFHM